MNTLISDDVATIDFTATTTARAVNAAFVVNNVLCVAKVAIAASGTGAISISGRHKLSKVTSKPVTSIFQKLYFDSGKVSAVATAHTLVGIAACTATTAEASVEIFVNVSSASAT